MSQCIPTRYGSGYIEWIYYVFGECVYGTQDAVSRSLGYFSILFWLNAQLPQVVENYKIGSADSLSLKFLSIWLAGDLANLIGCILTHQRPFQFYLSVYFVSIDICLLCQWIYYSKFKRKPSKRIQSSKETILSAFQHPSVRTPLLIQSSDQIINDELLPYSVSASLSKYYTLEATRKFYQDSPLESVFADDPLIIGRVLAWICTCLYLMSRIPQILKNKRRKSVEGLSPSLFVFAALGNFTYASSILTAPDNTPGTLLEALPYLIGSAGTLTFDATIFAQYMWYRRKPAHTHSIQRSHAIV
ncbi:PQ loop repeat-domain-containing protein [Radiomyces spectabilis]|uniref:PQ loop repeat-domain-containing protein n=1 Tax=Radiomyces spectabilis TaxID=64574 RepID=UPI0022208741|nr:PQ loop repeat-domain-containing protein [Radiomyces spectabilis]KAI8364367.1 PQ loop repeat-domain-containing protein [Radiomyces spectabilis]